MKGREQKRSLLTLAVVALLMHYPRWFFLLDETAAWLGTKPWSNDFSVACRWDCAYYTGQSEGLSAARAAFFPLFPLLARALRTLAPALTPSGSVVIASNVLSILAVMAIIALGCALWGTDHQTALPLDASDRAKSGIPGDLRLFSWKGRPWVAWVFGLAVAAFPFSQFASYGYSEPLFLLLFAACVLGVARGRWSWAALAAGLAAATRPQGIWLAAVVAGLYLARGRGVPPAEEARDRRPSARAREKVAPARERAWVLLLLSLPIALYMVWNRIVCGDSLYFLKMQGQWGRHFDFWDGLKNQLPRYELNRVLFYLSLAASWRFIRRPEAHWRLLGWSSFLMAEIPLFIGGFAFSYSRFMSANLGLFAFLAEVIAARLWLLILALLWALPWLNLEIVRWVRTAPYHGIGP